MIPVHVDLQGRCGSAAWGILLLALGAALTCGAEDKGVSAAEGLAGRLFGDRAVEFTFSIIPGENDHDVFEVEAQDGHAVIRGSSGVAMATGLKARIAPITQAGKVRPIGLFIFHYLPNYSAGPFRHVQV